MSPQQVSQLAGKLYDVDPDIRFMSLNDLLAIFNSSQNSAFLVNDYGGCAKLIDGFLHTLSDTNGEVQNLTIKCLGPFVIRAHPNVLSPLFHRIGTLDVEQVVDRSLPALAIRAIVVALPRPLSGTPRTKQVSLAYEAVSRVLVPRLVGYIVVPQSDSAKISPPPKGLLEEDLERGTDSNAIDVLTEVARCFGPMLYTEEIKALQSITTQFLESNRSTSGMKKKAVGALAVLSPFFSDQLLSSVTSQLIEQLRDSHLTPPSRRLNISVLASLAKAVPNKFGPHLKMLCPFVLAPLSQEELDQSEADMEEDDAGHHEVNEVREAALIALDAFLTSCPSEMHRFYDECTEATIRYIKYDPFFVEPDEDPSDQEDAADDDEFELDEDFEEDQAAGDEDDLTWKLRRCAARTLTTLIAVRGSNLLENSLVFENVAQSLIARFQEREETVRLEVLATFSFLIRKAGTEQFHFDGASNAVEFPLPTQPPSRKRRRGYSDVSMTEPFKHGRFTGSCSPEFHPSARAGAHANLADISNDIFGSLLKLLKSTSGPTRQAAMGTLKDLIITLQGGAAEHLGSLLPPVVEMANTSVAVGQSASAVTTAGTPLQSQALQLISEVTKMHSSTTVKPHLPQMVPAVISAAQSRNSKIAGEALSTTSQLVKAMTPPRNASSDSRSSKLLEQILDAILELINAKTADLSVRLEAINILGVLLGRVMDPKGAKILPSTRRAEAFELLYDTCKNETTRLTSIKAIEAIMVQAPEGTVFDQIWYGKVALEFAAQLRKADRSLRNGSAHALRTMFIRHLSASNLDAESSQQVLDMVLPLLTSDDLQLLGPALNITACMINSGSLSQISPEMQSQICGLAKAPAAASVLDSLCTLMQSIGERKLGQGLMTALLKEVGILGSPAVVGKVVGNLVVYGAGSVGVTSQDFLSELETTPDHRRKSLALSVLGEIGLRSGSLSKLSPDLFIRYFEANSDDVTLAAAIALGRASAGAGNLSEWVPMILNRIKQVSGEHYLALHAIRELLQYNEHDKEILPFTGALWDATLAASRSEENRTVGAECIANLTLIDPPKFLPALQSFLSDDSALVRRTSILAFRDVFTISDATYDKDLRPVIVDVVTTMMRDPEVENRRAALNTFNAAVRHKSSLILPHMATLQSLVIDQTLKDPSLTREVSMGPFKHQVDDGLEVRKNAYETLYSLLEISPQRIDVIKAYDRIVAGVNDDRGIQTLCNLMILKLITTAPEETVKRLDDLASAFTTIITYTPKENAVRQELEKADEAKKAVIKVSLELMRHFGAEAASVSKWTSYMEEMKQAKEGALLKEVEKESRDRDRV